MITAFKSLNFMLIKTKIFVNKLKISTVFGLLFNTIVLK